MRLTFLRPDSGDTQFSFARVGQRLGRRGDRRRARARNPIFVVSWLPDHGLGRSPEKRRENRRSFSKDIDAFELRKAGATPRSRFRTGLKIAVIVSTTHHESTTGFWGSSGRESNNRQDQ